MIQLPPSIVIGSGEVEVLRAIEDAAMEMSELPTPYQSARWWTLTRISAFAAIAADSIRSTYRVHPVPASEPIPLPWKEVECDEAGIAEVLEWLQETAYAKLKWPTHVLRDPRANVVTALMFAKYAIATAFAEARLQEGK